MKKIILAGIIFMMFMGIASASSINGDFEGNPIVTITNSGNVVGFDDVPAIIYKGRTMVPISLLKKIGAQVNWDQKKYSVDINLPATNSNVLIVVKILTEEVDNFTMTENTSEYFQTFIPTLSSYFTEANNNYSTRMTSVDLENRFQQMKSTLNTNSEIINSFIKNNPNADNTKLTEQITNISDGLNLLESAKNNLIGWDNLRYSNPNNSQIDFNAYLDNITKANTIFSTVDTSSHGEYLVRINAILGL